MDTVEARSAKPKDRSRAHFCPCQSADMGDFEKFERLCDRAFNEAGPENPLQRMAQRDRHYLIAIFTLFARSRGGIVIPSLLELEEADRIASDAGKLAVRIRDTVLCGQVGELDDFPRRFHGLPQLLEQFSDYLSALLGPLGKPGQKQKILLNRLVVTASEFVKLRTGSYNDEHLAEVLQTILDDPDEDFSAQAIRKKREQTRRSYPRQYAEAERAARAGAGQSDSIAE